MGYCEWDGDDDTFELDNKGLNKFNSLYKSSFLNKESSPDMFDRVCGTPVESQNDKDTFKP